ncbi:PH domain-containing protein [Longispora sp. K20-0274]|uniref:PH domain-containing protein n=1 Tax=Longispora sp. K20-0274 TaxID=3088255 RepID=UPI00399ADF37
MSPSLPVRQPTAAPRRDRVHLALVVALLAGGLGVLAARLTVWDVAPGVSGKLFITAILVLFGLTVAAVVLDVKWNRAPARLVVRDGAFVAPPRSRGLAFRLLRAPTSLVFPGTVTLPALDPGPARTGVGALYVLAVLVSTALAFRPGPRVILTPAGVEFAGMFRSRRAPWEDIADVLPTPKVRVRGAWWSLGEDRLDVAPGYTADAIVHYLRYPDRRPLIGTEAEHDRLHRELSTLWAARAAAYAAARPAPRP